jgi:hypothetical protein
LLSEAGLADEDALAPVLVELHGLGQAASPAPCPQLAALLDPPRRAQHRRPPRRRGAVIALVVAASLGSGITAAAADPQVREAAAHVVASVVAPTIDLPTVEVGKPSGRPTNTGAPVVPPPVATASHSPVVPSADSAQARSSASTGKTEPAKKKQVGTHPSRRHLLGTKKPAKPATVPARRTAAAAAQHTSARTTD